MCPNFEMGIKDGRRLIFLLSCPKIWNAHRLNSIQWEKLNRNHTIWLAPTKKKRLHFIPNRNRFTCLNKKKKTPNVVGWTKATSKRYYDQMAQPHVHQSLWFPGKGNWEWNEMKWISEIESIPCLEPLLSLHQKTKSSMILFSDFQYSPRLFFFALVNNNKSERPLNTLGIHFWLCRVERYYSSTNQITISALIKLCFQREISTILLLNSSFKFGFRFSRISVLSKSACCSRSADKTDKKREKTQALAYTRSETSFSLKRARLFPGFWLSTNVSWKPLLLIENGASGREKHRHSAINGQLQIECKMCSFFEFHSIKLQLIRPVARQRRRRRRRPFVIRMG